jgi:hypothetical protein
MRLPHFITLPVAPSLLLGLLWLYPERDRHVHLPLFHFYAVTCTTFATAVVFTLLAMILRPVAQIRLPRVTVKLVVIPFLAAGYLPGHAVRAGYSERAEISQRSGFVQVLAAQVGARANWHLIAIYAKLPEEPADTVGS